MSSYLNICWNWYCFFKKNMAVQKQYLPIVLTCLYYAYKLLSPKLNAIHFHLQTKLLFLLIIYFLVQFYNKAFFIIIL